MSPVLTGGLTARRALLIFACVVLKGVLTYVGSLLSTSLTARVPHRLRLGIFEQVLSVDYRYLDATGSAKFMNALHTESWRVTHAVSTFLASLITLCALLVYVALLLLLSPALTFVVVALMTLIMVLMRFLMRGVGRGRRRPDPHQRGDRTAHGRWRGRHRGHSGLRQ